MNLLDLPIVNALATWIWANDPHPDVSPEFCLAAVNDDEKEYNIVVSLFMLFWNMPESCWGRLMAKGLGIGIILGACISKTPVIFNLLESQSTAGLSKHGLYAEVILLANSAAYGILEGHPFTAYGEVVALLLQSMILVSLFWQYSGRESNSGVSHSEQFLVAMVCAGYVMILAFVWLPEWNFLLLAVGWPIMLYSRITQLWESARAKHTGAQSGITLGLNTIGTTIRLFTTYEEVGFEMALFLNYGIAFATNVALLGQYFYYYKNTQQFVQRRKKEQSLEQQQNKKEKKQQ